MQEQGHWHIGPTSIDGNFQGDFDFDRGPGAHAMKGRISTSVLLLLIALPLLLVFALFRQAHRTNRPDNDAVDRLGSRDGRLGIGGFGGTC